MTHYRNTQPGTLTRIALGAGLLLQLMIVLLARGNALVLLICGSVALLTLGFLYVFHSMTVEVDDRAVGFRFGNSRFGKRFPLNEIESVTAVRNPWFFGWGVRYYFKGWLYNVSGLDAVELAMKDGRHVRLGTDDPTRLVHAIERGLSASRSP